MIDLATRRIPNGVVVATAIVGLLAAASGASDISVGMSLLGLGLGLALMLPGHVFGGTGAGDVKLFGAVGAVVGVERILWVFCYTAIVGGVLAIIWALSRGRLAPTLRRLMGLLRLPQQTGTTTLAGATPDPFPYGPAIAVGSVLALLVRG